MDMCRLEVIQFDNFKIQQYMEDGNSSAVTEKIKTKLKFVKSDVTGNYISFVSRNTKNGQIRGVRRDSEYPKKICVVDKSIAFEVMPDVLYDVVMVPMISGKGFVVISMEPSVFRATVETTYVPKAVYVVEVRFGNRKIRFDPLDGRSATVRDLGGCVEFLERRLDIMNRQQVIRDFKEAANLLLEHFHNDGFYESSSRTHTA